MGLSTKSFFPMIVVYVIAESVDLLACIFTRGCITERSYREIRERTASSLSARSVTLLWFMTLESVAAASCGCNGIGDTRAACRIRNPRRARRMETERVRVGVILVDAQYFEGREKSISNTVYSGQFVYTQSSTRRESHMTTFLPRYSFQVHNQSWKRSLS